MGHEELGEAVLQSIRESVAALDPVGRVRWANDSWLRTRSEEGHDTVAAVAIGESFLDVARASGSHCAIVIANGIDAVLKGASAYFELEHRPYSGDHRWFSLSATPLRGGRGSVLTQREVGVRDSVVSVVEAMIDGGVALASPRHGAAADGVPVEELTPREREVLELLARGHDNRAIASELAIAYTTVRGHVRSLIAKFGARSRLELVAHAYQRGIVSGRER